LLRRGSPERRSSDKLPGYATAKSEKRFDAQVLALIPSSPQLTASVSLPNRLPPHPTPPAAAQIHTGIFVRLDPVFSSTEILRDPDLHCRDSSPSSSSSQQPDPPPRPPPPSPQPCSAPVSSCSSSRSPCRAAGGER
jgi:hypothetical protein